MRTSNLDKILEWRPADMKLANVEVAPQHRSRFTVAIVNHILWLPQISFPICALMVVLVSWSSVGLRTSLMALAGGFAIAAYGFFTRKSFSNRPDRSHYRELEQLKLLAVLSGLYWAGIFAIFIPAMDGAHVAELTLMAAYLMFLGCVRYISVPNTGIMQIFSIMLGACAGLVSLGTAPALISAAVLILFGVTLFSVIYNLFYSFATRRLRTRTLNETKETIELLLKDFDEQGSDWLWEVDSSGRIIRPSERFSTAAVRSTEELAKSKFLDIFEAGTERDELQEKLDLKLPFRRVYAKLLLKGEERTWSLSARPSVNKYGEVVGMRGVATDVSEAKKAEAQIAYMAHFDGLTDLPNRAFFAESLRRAYERKREDEVLGILYLDLDRFKSINDSMGHDVGDFVLKEVSKRITSCIRTADMAARLGGDEFAILINSATRREEVLKVALRIIEALEEPIIMDGQLIRTGTSVGIAFADNDVEHPSDLLKYADLALYDAKSRGGNIALTFLPKMYDDMLMKRSTEADLASSISNGELELYYQPLVSVETSQVVAYEALLRWNHPVYGQIQPNIFIPIAEETGLIVQIGEWVIRNALMEVAKWPEHLSVSVNVSPAQMRSPNLVPTIVNALAASGVSPDRLEIEITESVLMHDSDANLELLHQFKSLGLRVALDDFGTGYSSLNYLRSFPFDKIKIDKCFVEGIEDRKDCQAIIQAVLSLASSLNMTTTAEGIEHATQLARLKEDGCDQVQGYLFSRPVPANQLEQKAVVNGIVKNVVPIIKRHKSAA